MIRPDQDFGPLRPRFLDEIGETENGFRFFQTLAGPGGTAYPSDPATVYYVEWLRDVSFTETPGNQSLNSTQSGHFGYVFNLETANYMEAGSIGLAFPMNGQYYTIDKVVGGDLVIVGGANTESETLQFLRSSGSQKWSASKQIAMLRVTIDDSGNVWASSIDATSTTNKMHRFDVDGNLLKEWTIADSKRVHSLATDAVGNVYIGLFNSTIANPDVFRKYDPDGNLLWSLNQNDDLWQTVLPKPEVDNDGNVYLSLEFATDNVTIKKYDSDGNHILDFEAADAAFPRATALSVALANDGSVYSSVTDETGGGIVILGTPYLRKYDADGAIVWSVALGSPGAGASAGLAPFLRTDAAGFVYVGNVNGVSKYDEDGNLVWNSWNPAPIFSGGVQRGLDIDVNGNVYAGHSHSGGPVLKFNSSGTYQGVFIQHNEVLQDLAVAPGRVPIFR